MLKEFGKNFFSVYNIQGDAWTFLGYLVGHWPFYKSSYFSAFSWYLTSITPPVNNILLTKNNVPKLG